MRISDWSSDVCSSDLKDPKYQPLPRAIVVRGNQHGKAGYAPKFPGGEQVAAAMGGSIPPILWDGAGDAIVLDAVGVLSLNLPDVATPPSEAKPAPADLSKGTPPAGLPAIKTGRATGRERVVQDVQDTVRAGC